MMELLKEIFLAGALFEIGFSGIMTAVLLVIAFLALLAVGIWYLVQIIAEKLDEKRCTKEAFDKWSDLPDPFEEEGEEDHDHEEL